MKLSYEINDEMVSEIDILTQRAGHITKKALFDNALTILQWAFRKIDSGYTVGALDTKENVFTELDMPIFENVRKSSGYYKRQDTEEDHPREATA